MQIDCSGVESFPVIQDEDRLVQVQESIKFVDGMYRIATPWKDNAVELTKQLLNGIEQIK